MTQAFVADWLGLISYMPSSPQKGAEGSKRQREVAP